MSELLKEIVLIASYLIIPLAWGLGVEYVFELVRGRRRAAQSVQRSLAEDNWYVI